MQRRKEPVVTVGTVVPIVAVVVPSRKIVVVVVVGVAIVHAGAVVRIEVARVVGIGSPIEG